MEDLKHEIKDTKGCGKRCHASRLASKTPRSSGLTSHAPTPWPKVRLGDICIKIVSGGTPSTKHSEYYGGVIPWLRTQEVDFKPIFSTELSISEAGLENSSAKWIPANTVVVAMYGATAGRSAIAKIPLTTNQACCNLVVDDKEADYRFVYYALRLLYEELEGLAKGSAQTNLSLGIIKSFQIPLPPLPVQRRIADILSAYDDLIENNRLRIAILEETARLTYRKWFGGMEEGRTTTLGDVLETIESGSRPRGGAVNDGVPSIGAEKIESIGVYDYSSEKFVSREYYDKMRRGKIRSGDVLLYKDGAYTGKVSMALNGFPHAEAAVNEHVFILRTRNLHAQCFVYCFLRQQEIYDKINTIASAKACQPGLNQSDVLNLEIEVPTDDEIGRFENRVIPLFDEIVNFAKQNAALVTARDMLLPRLMNNKLRKEA